MCLVVISKRKQSNETGAGKNMENNTRQPKYKKKNTTSQRTNFRIAKFSLYTEGERERAREDLRASQALLSSK